MPIERMSDMKEEMDELEAFVRKNREAFDPLEPDPELWKRIIPEERAKPSKSAARPWYATVPFRAAAAVLVLAAATLFYTKLDSGNPQVAEAIQPVEQPAESTPADEALEGLIPELLEAEAFYAHQVEEKLVELKATNPAMEEEIRYDLAELDRAYVELKQDLNEDLANREIVEAMIQNYRLKLKVLESILQQLQKTETKTPDNGTDDYLL